MTTFQPANSNPRDGELITLCKILEAVSTSCKVANGSITMSNGTATASSATLLAASTATKSLAIQNTASTGTIYISTTSPATATNGISLAAGQGYEFSLVPTNALYVLGSSASVTYTIWYA
jgi:hypothetical protein